MDLYGSDRATNLENVYLIDYDEEEEDEKDSMNYLQKRSIGISNKIKRRNGRWTHPIISRANGFTVVSANAVKIVVRA